MPVVQSVTESKPKNDDEIVQTEADPNAYRKPTILESTPDEVRNVVAGILSLQTGINFGSKLHFNSFKQPWIYETLF